MSVESQGTKPADTYNIIQNSFLTLPETKEVITCGAITAVAALALTYFKETVFFVAVAGTSSFICKNFCQLETRASIEKKVTELWNKFNTYAKAATIAAAFVAYWTMPLLTAAVLGALSSTRGANNELKGRGPEENAKVNHENAQPTPPQSHSASSASGG